MTEIPILIIGATSLGIALACEKPKQTLIVERSINFGSEFIGALAINKHDMSKNVSKKTTQLKDELLKRNLLSEQGEIHIFPCSPLLALKAKQAEVNTLLMTEVVSILKQKNGYVVTIYNCDGFSKIFAYKIIDTTAVGALENANFQKSMGAVLVSGNSDLRNYSDDFCKVLKGRFDNEYVLQLKLDRNDSWPVARRKFQEFWEEKHDTVFKNWEVASFGSEFMYAFTEFRDGYTFEKDENWILKPSISFGDFLSAYEEGLKCSLLL